MLRRGDDGLVAADDATAALSRALSVLVSTDDRACDQISEAIDHAADLTASVPIRQALRRASRALFQQPPGPRQKFNDGKLIAEAMHLIETGQQKIEWRALLQVAKTQPGPSQKSIAERLRRRIRRESVLPST